MRGNRIGGLAVLLSFGLASSGPARQSDKLVLEVPTSTASCPVDVQAEHKAGGGELLARRGGSGSAQRLSVSIANRKASEIVGIGLTIYGTSGKAQREDAQTVAPHILGWGEMARHVYLPLRIQAQKRSATELTLPRFTAVRYLELASVTFADGEVWHPEPARACRFYPSKLMLVEGQ